jgi:hypothetical protein
MNTSFDDEASWAHAVASPFPTHSDSFVGVANLNLVLSFGTHSHYLIDHFILISFWIILHYLIDHFIFILISF